MLQLLGFLHKYCAPTFLNSQCWLVYGGCRPDSTINFMFDIEENNIHRYYKLIIYLFCLIIRYTTIKHVCTYSLIIVKLKQQQSSGILHILTYKIIIFNINIFHTGTFYIYT